MQTIEAPRVNGTPQRYGRLPTAPLVAPANPNEHQANPSNPAATPTKARGTGPFYLVAGICSAVSLDTAFRYFGQHMGINGTINGLPAERAILCGVGELTLIACGYAMRHNVRRAGTPGPAQLVALSLCTAAAFMAIALDGPVAGALRAFFGPIMALVALHLALGIEVHVRHGRSSATLARVTRELRERALSRLGLADDTRDAAQRTQDRALHRAARLATTRWTLRHRRRLARAVRMSGAAVDTDRLVQLRHEVAALRNIGDLMTTAWASPWLAGADIAVDATGGQTAGQTAMSTATVSTQTTGDERTCPVDTAADTTGASSTRSVPTRRPRPRRRVHPNPTGHRPDKASQVRAYAAGHPDESQADIAAAVGVSTKTVQRALSTPKETTS